MRSDVGCCILAENVLCGTVTVPSLTYLNQIVEEELEAEPENRDGGRMPQDDEQGSALRWFR